MNQQNGMDCPPMDLRDWFAGMAMSGLSSQYSANGTADKAYEYADAMMARRAETITLEIAAERLRARQKPKPKPQPKPVKVPPELDTPEALAALEEFRAHRVDIKKKITPTMEKRMLSIWADRGPERFAEAVKWSIANGWQGLFEPDADQRGEIDSGQFEADRELLNAVARGETPGKPSDVVLLTGGD